MSMRYTPQQKLEILSEARKGGYSVSQVCRRHGIGTTAFYDWERRFQEAGLQGLGRGHSEQEIDRIEQLEREVARLKNLVAEVVDENVKLKKGQWP